MDFNDIIWIGAGIVLIMALFFLRRRTPPAPVQQEIEEILAKEEYKVKSQFDD